MNHHIPEKILSDGLHIPSIGFGTAKLNGHEAVEVVQNAIRSGYRLIDTAFNYDNEGAVGEAIRRSPVSRSEIMVTSKLPGRYHSYEEAVKAIQESLLRTGLDYFDLYLIHWPNPEQDNYVEAWQALIDARRWGLVRSIGVCNFLPEHLDNLKEKTGVLPTLNQIEMHPYFIQETQRSYHDENGILTEAWSPLARARELQDDPVLAKVAEKHGKSTAQIVLRWHYQLGTITIPKASSPERQMENLSIFDFELDDEDINRISSLTKEDGRIDDQNPATYEEF
ncbi:aldo/keto reductase [Salinicoccus sesuvii]|uniref:Aldo/keto reductase n=1 Tax=Salinicoccus sesuvii TaxID=868281 RepID=A0ABV7N4Q6_9STAP